LKTAETSEKASGKAQERGVSIGDTASEWNAARWLYCHFRQNYYLWTSALSRHAVVYAYHSLMSFISCPEGFNKQNIIVPDNAKGISQQIQSCEIAALAESTSTSSFFFSIDNSSSTQTSDPAAARLLVIKAPLDTIYLKQPVVQAGIAVFEDCLLFDISTTATFGYSKLTDSMAPIIITQKNVIKQTRIRQSSLSSQFIISTPLPYTCIIS
jgi:hypothetical protein